MPLKHLAAFRSRRAFRHTAPIYFLGRDRRSFSHTGCAFVPVTLLGSALHRLDCVRTSVRPHYDAERRRKARRRSVGALQPPW